MLNTPKNYTSDLPFLPKRMKTDKCKKLVCNLHNKKKIRRTYKVIKTTIKSWIKIKKHSQNYRIYSKSMAQIIYRYEYRIKKISKR